MRHQYGNMYPSKRRLKSDNYTRVFRTDGNNHLVTQLMQASLTMSEPNIEKKGKVTFTSAFFHKMTTGGATAVVATAVRNNPKF